MHERVVFLTAISRTVPHVDPAYMTEIQDLGEGCYAVKVSSDFRIRLTLRSSSACWRGTTL